MSLMREVMGMKRWRVAAALALALLGPVFAWVGDAVAARTVIDQDARGRFGGPHRRGGEADLEQRRAYAYYDASEIATLNGEQGSVQIQLTRAEEANRRDYKPLVLFEDKEGTLPVEIQVNWVHRGADMHTAVIIGGTGEGYGIWGHVVDLGRTVAVGETVTITLTWGKTPDDNRVYLNRVEGRYLQPRKETFGEIFAKVERVAVYSPLARKKVDDSEIEFKADIDVPLVVFHDTPLFAEGPAPELTAVSHDAGVKAGFSGKLVAGSTFTVTAQGSAGAAGTFDIAHYPDLGGKLTLDWQGWGVVQEGRTLRPAAGIDLREVTGYRVYGSAEPFDPAAPGFEPAAVLKVGEQSYTFEFLAVDKPWYVGVAATMRDGSVRRVIAPATGVPLAETEPGTYTGSYQVRWRDHYPRAVVVARLGSGPEAAELAAPQTLAIDTALTVAVETEPRELRADEKSKSRVTVQVTNANGDPVPGHRIDFLLATTSQYTGVVGGGAFADQVGGAIDSRDLVTDFFGKVSTTYVAGFAAKTAIIVARDMTSNDTGAGFVTTFIQSRAELELTSVDPVALAGGYSITVTSSDEWLTADGESEARITAQVTLGGQPVEGRRVRFSVSSGTGSIRAVKDVTDSEGMARAVYTAGKKIGVVLITARDVQAGVSGSVSIELRSDAPAKIAVVVDPPTLPADGRSRSELLVSVTDVNDNPSDNVAVEFSVVSGGGELEDARVLTDRRGEAATEYVAGRSPGQVAIDITVRSTIPVEEEVAKARALALAVTDYDFY